MMEMFVFGFVSALLLIVMLLLTFKKSLGLYVAAIFAGAVNRCAEDGTLAEFNERLNQLSEQNGGRPFTIIYGQRLE